MRVVHGSNRPLNEEYCDNTMRSTKYTFWSFLPLNLAEQFSRHQNRYYLLIACLQLISILTPVSPVSTWAPLIVVFAIAAAKEAVDDRGRAQQDRQANERLFNVSRNGKMKKVPVSPFHLAEMITLLMLLLCSRSRFMWAMSCVSSPESKSLAISSCLRRPRRMARVSCRP